MRSVSLALARPSPSTQGRSGKTSALSAPRSSDSCSVVARFLRFRKRKLPLKILSPEKLSEKFPITNCYWTGTLKTAPTATSGRGALSTGISSATTVGLHLSSRYEVLNMVFESDLSPNRAQGHCRPRLGALDARRPLFRARFMARLLIT